MKSISILILLFSTQLTFGQRSIVESKILTEPEVQTIFTDSTKKELGIRFPIFRVYEYNDKLGNHYFVLSENKLDNKPTNDSIKAFNIISESKKLTVKWTINDFRLKANEVSEEKSIWFWSKYIELNDINGDKIIDPIITYGTSGINATGDGRIKILIYYENNKRAIRHQNGELDFQRNTKVDKDFYELPSQIQMRVKEIMKTMMLDNNAIFPGGWEEAMKNKKLTFDENHK